MLFNKIINNILFENSFSKEDKIAALKRLSSPEHEYTVDIYTDSGEWNYQLTGKGLYQALCNLPDPLFNRLFDGVKDPAKSFENSEKELIDYINSAHRNNFMSQLFYVNIFKNGYLLCTSDVQFQENIGKLMVS